MKKNIIILMILLCCFTFGQVQKTSQTKLTDKWFFGAEVGRNTISSYRVNFGESDKSFQFGFTTEYYWANNWSVTAKIKYFKTGVSFASDGKLGFFDIFLAIAGVEGDVKKGVFKGEVISVPVAINFNHNLFSPNLKVVYRLGLVYNKEVKSEYNFSENVSTNNPKTYINTNVGFGLHCFVNNKTAIYLDYDYHRLGGSKAKESGSFGESFYTSNNLLSLGVKHSFN
jgi:Outer membrane protein beta-barrel domain